MRGFRSGFRSAATHRSLHRFAQLFQRREYAALLQHLADGRIQVRQHRVQDDLEFLVDVLAHLAPHVDAGQCIVERPCERRRSDRHDVFVAPRLRDHAEPRTDLEQNVAESVFGLGDDFRDRQPFFELFGIDDLQLRAAAGLATAAFFEHRLEIGNLIDLCNHRTAELRTNRVALFFQLIEAFEVHHLYCVRSGIARFQQQIAIALLEKQFRNAVDAARGDPAQLFFDLFRVLIANTTIAQERFRDFGRTFRLRRCGFRLGFATAREIGGAVRDHAGRNCEVHQHFERFRLQRRRESNTHAAAGIEHARNLRLHPEMLFALRRRNGEMQIQRIAGARFSAGGYQRARTAGADQQHAALAEVANRAQPRPPFLRVYERADRDGLSRVSSPVHVLLLRLRCAECTPECGRESLTDLRGVGHLPAAGDMARVSVSGATTTRFLP